MELNGLLLQAAQPTELGTWEILTRLIALGTAIGAVIGYFISLKEKHSERKSKQAQSAKQLVDEIHDDEYAKAAVKMMDWFEVIKAERAKDKGKVETNYELVLSALSKVKLKKHTPEEHEIMECFDWFFYFIDRIEQGVQEELICFENVKYIFWPYFKKIRKDKEIYYAFMEARNYILAQRFWDRYRNDREFSEKVHRLELELPLPAVRENPVTTPN